jgi:epoxyqueuosine reductase
VKSAGWEIIEKMKSAAEIREFVKRWAGQAGFQLSGMVGVPPEGFGELHHFPDWVAEGRAGEMEYLKSRNEAGELKRAHLHHVAPWAKSVIVCAINYNSDQPYSTEVQDSERGWISRYAWFKNADAGKATDYHDAVLARLRRVEAALHEVAGELSPGPVQTRCYVDTGPLVERVYAKYAGIGWLAKNTCVINQSYGSWLFLGTILTSIEMQDDAAALAAPPDRCGSCTRCIEACPTNALIAPYQMDATRCISYLTIEKRGDIPMEFRDKMGNNIFGCDICQDVCPWNGHAQPNGQVVGKTPRKMPVTSTPEFQPREELVAPKLEELARLSRDEFNRMFRGSPIKRAKYQGLRRNIAVTMGNSEDPQFVPVLEEMSRDEDANIAEHARWALQKLNSK